MFPKNLPDERILDKAAEFEKSLKPGPGISDQSEFY